MAQQAASVAPLHVVRQGQPQGAPRRLWRPVWKHCRTTCSGRHRRLVTPGRIPRAKKSLYRIIFKIFFKKVKNKKNSTCAQQGMRPGDSYCLSFICLATWFVSVVFRLGLLGEHALTPLLKYSDRATNPNNLSVQAFYFFDLPGCMSECSSRHNNPADKIFEF